MTNKADIISEFLWISNMNEWMIPIAQGQKDHRRWLKVQDGRIISMVKRKNIITSKQVENTLKQVGVSLGLQSKDAFVNGNRCLQWGANHWLQAQASENMWKSQVYICLDRQNQLWLLSQWWTRRGKVSMSSTVEAVLWHGYTVHVVCIDDVTADRRGQRILKCRGGYTLCSDSTECCKLDWTVLQSSNG